jgi:hypothetical protein
VTEEALNVHGDRLVPTTGSHGADIASQRLDGLDRAALRHALAVKVTEEMPATALDLGGGRGMLALRLAALGLDTLLVDRLPREQTVLGQPGLADWLPLRHLARDARALRADDLPENLAVCCSQRFIHYLRHGEALALLALVRSRMRPDAKLFLSASGLDSELGQGYAGRGVALTARHAVLAPAMADKHGIHEPVCLYAPDELKALGEAAGFHCERVFESTFGNVKAVFAVTAGEVR